jgi:spore maturation protein CgeB
MRFVIFGLTLSSSWGNGHATLWRGLLRALARRGHQVAFFERDVPYYAQHRDLHAMQGVKLTLYEDWPSTLSRVRRELAIADVAIVTSYCADAVDASRLMLDETTRALRVFYDLDTPVTLARLSKGLDVDYLPPEGLGSFDLVLSYTGGGALTALRERLGARRVAPLYGHVDPQAHRPVAAEHRYRADLSYLGTYSPDRQEMVQRLFTESARARPRMRFALGGSGYADQFPWRENIYFVQHVPPLDHPAFFCSSRLTLNVTRGDMAAMGHCPSGRLFEAAACGVPLLSDRWDGLNQFFTPAEEILTAATTPEATEALDRTPDDLSLIAQRARARTLDEHTSEHRARELLNTLDDIDRAPLGSSCGPRDTAVILSTQG